MVEAFSNSRPAWCPLSRWDWATEFLNCCVDPLFWVSSFLASRFSIGFLVLPTLVLFFFLFPFLLLGFCKSENWILLQQKLAKKDRAPIDRNRDVENLWEFYKRYKRRYRVDEMQREEQRLLESGSSNLGEYGELLLALVTQYLSWLPSIMFYYVNCAMISGIMGFFFFCSHTKVCLLKWILNIGMVKTPRWQWRMLESSER